MRTKIAAILAMVLLAGTMLVGSTASTAAPSWSVRGSAMAYSLRADSTNGAFADANADSRRAPDRVQIVLRWDAPSGGANRVDYSWYTTCWNQSNINNSGRKLAVYTSAWDRHVTLASGEVYRENLETYDRQFCEVNVYAHVDTRPPGRLIVKIRDLK